MKVNDESLFPIAKNFFDRAVLNEGSAEGFYRAFSKSQTLSQITSKHQTKSTQSLEPFKIVALGGSITEGAMAPTPMHRFAQRFAFSYWQKFFAKAGLSFVWKAPWASCGYKLSHFPASFDDYNEFEFQQISVPEFEQQAFQFINAGIGATGSLLGVHRCDEHVLKYEPDIVLLEFAVNDVTIDHCEFYFEGLIRKLLKAPKKPAIFILMNMWEKGTNVEEVHGNIARHYQIPAVSLKKLWAEMPNEGQNWSKFADDSVHPNQQGHKIIAELLWHHLQKLHSQFTNLAETQQSFKAQSDFPLVEPLYYDAGRFENSSCIGPGLAGRQNQVGTLAVPLLSIKLSGWWWSSGSPYSPLGDCWETHLPGSTLTLDFVSDHVGIVYYQSCTDLGIIRVELDGQIMGEYSAKMEETWGGYPQPQIIAIGLEIKKHHLKIVFLGGRGLSEKIAKFNLLRILF